MKRFICIFVLLFSLCGCNSQSSDLDQALSLRQKLLSGDCSFDARITADYGDKIYQFDLHCQADSSGDLKFRVLAPASITGITGTVQDEKGALTFDDQVLAFSMLADGQVTPVTAPWVMLKTLRGGYLSSCCAEGKGLYMTIYDSYHSDALQLDIWTDGDVAPVRAEILFRGRRILTIEVTNFSYL